MRGLPKHAHEIDAAWLTHALRDGGAIDATTTVTDVVVEPLAEGVGFMGEVARVRPAYTRGTGPASLIAKIPTQDPHVRDVLAPARVFEREARFYRYLAPQLDVTPDAYYVGEDSVAGDYVLLLEDLGHLRMGDQVAGASADDAAAALEALAHFHATFWTSPRLDDLDWMPPIDDPGMKIGREIYASSLPGFMQVFGDVLDDVGADMEVVERFADNVHQLMDRFAAMPHTIVHFDYRLDNLFFGDTASERPGVTMIDFQASTKGGGAYDVGYFLSQNLRTDVRQAHEEGLLRGYHDVLVADGVDGYSLEQLRSDYRVGVLYGWIIPVYAVGTLDSSSERAMALWREVIGRAQAAIQDHAVRDLLI
jgi:Ecdysteroid kinase-like family